MVILKERTRNREGFDMLDFLLEHHLLIFESSWIIALLTLMIATMISLEKRDPAKTLCWLLVLFLVPVLGIVFYLLFGENLRGKKWSRRRQTIQEFLDSDEAMAIFHPKTLETLNKMAEQNIYFEEMDSSIVNLVMRSGTVPITIHNKIAVYTDGCDKFAQMMEDIRNAQDHIHLEYFIIKDGNLARPLRELLIEKAQQGVEVRILYDDIGSWRLYTNPMFMHGLRAAGVEAKTYVQARFPYLHRKLNYRNHRKICVIDGKIGYVGGLNIGDEYVHGSKKFGYWRDTHLRIEGPAVYSLQTVFITDWLTLTDKRLIDARYFPMVDTTKGTSMVQIATSGADSANQTIYEAYFYAMAQARETIYIETPYFVPDEAVLTALKTASLSGVNIKIIFPSIADHFTVYHASLSYLEQIMSVGAEIYFYDKQPGPSFIHSKVLLVDHEVASVGTANMDIRSFMINSEINAFIYDNKTVNQLYQMFERDLEDSRRITEAEFQQKGFGKRMVESFCRLFSPLL